MSVAVPTMLITELPVQDTHIDNEVIYKILQTPF